MDAEYMAYLIDLPVYMYETSYQWIEDEYGKPRRRARSRLIGQKLNNLKLKKQ